MHERILALHGFPVRVEMSSKEQIAMPPKTVLKKRLSLTSLGFLLVLALMAFVVPRRPARADGGTPFKANTVHLRMLMHFAMLTYLVCSRCLGRSGYLLILRFTPREFHRLRLDTTRSSRISSRIAWCKFLLA